MAKGSGSGASGVAGGGGKFDENKHKRANDGKFSSSGGGGGGGVASDAASGRKSGGAGDPAKGTGNTRDKKPGYAKTSSDRVADDLHDRVNAEHKQKRTVGNAMQRAGARKKFGDRQVVSEKEARSLKPAETEHLVANRGHEIVGTTFAQVDGVGRYIHAVRGPDGKTTVATREDVEAWLTRDPKSSQSPDALKGGGKLFKPGDLKPKRDAKKLEPKKPDAKNADAKTSSPAGPSKPKYEGRFGRTEVPIAGAGDVSGDAPSGKGSPGKSNASDGGHVGIGDKPTIQQAAKALESRGYALGRGGGSEKVGGKWHTTYEVITPSGKPLMVEAGKLKEWLNRPHVKGQHPVGYAPKRGGGNSPQSKSPSKPRPEPSENSPGKSPEKASGKSPEKSPEKTPDKSPEKSTKKSPSLPPAGKEKPKSQKDAAASGDGKPVDSPKKNTNSSDQIVDAELIDDGNASGSGGGKSGGGGDSGSKHHVTNLSDSSRRAFSPHAAYAEMTRPKATMASSVAAWAANKLGFPSYSGPDGSRVMALHMKQMHDEMQRNGFNPIQAYQTNFGPVIDYHHAGRGLVMRIQRHAGRKGRTAMKLIGMLTGLKKAAGSASIGTLIPLAAQGDGSKTRMGGGSEAGGKSGSGKSGSGKSGSGKKIGGKYAGYLKKLEARRGKKLSKSFASKGGCAMVRLPDNLAEKIIRLQASISVDDLLGFEDSPHVTVRYGVLASGEQVSDAVRGVGSVTFGLGRLDCFSNADRDVLFVRVLDNQGQLNELRRRIESGCECKQSDYSQYIPHVTVAYLKPGTAERYLSRENPLFGLDVTCYEVRYAEKGEISLEKSLERPSNFLSPLASIGKSWRISKDQGYNPHRDNSGRFASGGGGGGAASGKDVSGKQLAGKYSGPVDSLHAEHRKALTAMPEGSRVEPTVGGRVNVNWDSDNGGGREHLDRVITAAKIQGFKSTGEEVSHDVNGDVEGRSEFFVHPDGHKLYVSTEAAAGSDGEDRHAAMMVLEPPPKEKPVAAATPTNPEHADKVAIMPQGAVTMSMKSGVTTASWSSEGEGGIKDVNSLINNAQEMGFTRESRQIDRGKDGSVMSVRAVYSHPDGHRLEIDREVMADGMPPFHSVLMTLKPSAKPAGKTGELAVAKAIKQSDLLAAGKMAANLSSDSQDADESCPHCGHKTASITLRSPFPLANRRCQESGGGCGKEWRSNADGTKTADVGDLTKSVSRAELPPLPLAKQGDSDAAAKFAEYFKMLGSYYSGV